MRAALSDAAERTLDLQYFSAGDDAASDVLLGRIVAAAERGVRVRILLDDMQTSTRAFARRAQAAHAGIQVRLFNPFRVSGTGSVPRLAEFLIANDRLNRRMHNKLWVSDNAVAITGSRNLGDEYSDANSSFNFLDVDLMAVGPVVPELSRTFDAYWNSAKAVPLEAIAPPVDDGERLSAREQLAARVTRCSAVAPCQWLAGEAARRERVERSEGRERIVRHGNRFLPEQVQGAGSTPSGCSARAAASSIAHTRDLKSSTP